MFNYTFLVERDLQIMPQSYDEFMVWVDARRRAINTEESLTGWREVGGMRGSVTE